jgi:hypothetical protein
MAVVTNRFARAMDALNPYPSARLAAIAAEKVHPVP